MGILRWLFGIGSLPSWSASFETPDAFERFVDAVLEALLGAGHEVSGAGVRSGSVQLTDDHGRDHEVMLQDLAERCARLPPPQWPDQISATLKLDYPDLFGGAEPVALDELGLDDPKAMPMGDEGVMIVGDYDEGGTGHLMLAATGWGGVYLVGLGRHVIVCAFPVADAQTLEVLGDLTGPNDLARLSPTPGLVAEALVLFNHTDDGFLHGSRLARQLGAKQLLATDPTRPIDRGVDEPKPSKAAPLVQQHDWPGIALRRLETVTPAYRAVLGPDLERDSVVLGLDLPYDAVMGPTAPGWIVGSLRPEDDIPDGLGDALLEAKHVVLVEDGTGVPTAQADLFTTLDVPVTLVGGTPDHQE